MTDPATEPARPVSDAPERPDREDLEAGDPPRASDDSPSEGVRAEFSLRTVRDFVLGVPRFAKLLFRLMRDRRVSSFDRVLFALTLGYVVVPFDLLPDWLPVLGELDDLLVVLIALDRLLYRTPEEVLIEHWEGDARPLFVLRDLLDRGVGVLPGWARGLLRAG